MNFEGYAANVSFFNFLKKHKHEFCNHHNEWKLFRNLLLYEILIRCVDNFWNPEGQAVVLGA